MNPVKYYISSIKCKINPHEKHKQKNAHPATTRRFGESSGGKEHNKSKETLLIGGDNCPIMSTSSPNRLWKMLLRCQESDFFFLWPFFCGKPMKKSASKKKSQIQSVSTAPDCGLYDTRTLFEFKYFEF